MEANCRCFRFVIYFEIKIFIIYMNAYSNKPSNSEKYFVFSLHIIPRNVSMRYWEQNNMQKKCNAYH